MNFARPDPAPPNAAVHATIQRATATVGIARGLLASGRDVDLTGLDTMAGALCAQVLDLSPAEGIEFRPALAELDASIAALADAMRQRARGNPDP